MPQNSEEPVSIYKKVIDPKFKDWVVFENGTCVIIYNRQKDLLDNLHVYVNQPPLEGKANIATISALADYFKTSKSDIKIISGAKSKYKLFEIR